MRSYIEVVASPTSDTPGTLLVLHYDDKRYLIGSLFEGTSRACLQHGLGLRKVDDILLTGRTKWTNIGGMFGMMLGLADLKKSAATAQASSDESRLAEKARRQNGQETSPQASQDNPKSELFLRIHGSPNLNYAIATARRFIFRTGMPIRAIEHGLSTAAADQTATSIAPSWVDDHLQVWCVPLRPDTRASGEDQTSPLRPRSRKRSHEEMNSDAADDLPRRIVKQMFDSDWRMDRLFSKALKDVQMPATVFVRDSATGQLAQYTGPLPGSGKELPDIEVLVRQPWPGALTETLEPAEPALESLCYIFKNHPQRGKFMPKKAQELGVEDKTLWGQLTKGHSVKNKHGEDITPEMVLEQGKQGGGAAVVELPSVEYVESLLSRAEWQDETVMEGIGAIFWALGPGVVYDIRLQGFMKQLSQIQHIVSSPDSRPDGLILETAVKSAWQHHNEDLEVYPKLVADNAHSTSATSASVNGLMDNVVIARRGLKLEIEPAVSLDKEGVVDYVDDQDMTKAVRKEHDRMFAEAQDLITPVVPEDGLQAGSDQPWQSHSAYGNIEISTLGTGSSHPSTHRNVSATLVRIPDHGSYIFDCGEGTLGTLQRMYTKPELDDLMRDLRMIWISHMHADHHLGTSSVIRAWYAAVHGSVPAESLAKGADLDKGGRRLAVVSDAPMLHWLREFSAIDDFGWSRLLPLATLPTRFATDPRNATPTGLKLASTTETVDADEIPASRYLEYMGLKELSTVLVPHCRGAQAIACTFPINAFDAENTTFKLCYSGDTRPSRPFACIGKRSHVLIHEATFDDDMRSEAFAKRHSTAGEALTVAKEMGAKLCVLTHFSQRYPKMSGMGGGNVGGQGGTKKLLSMGIDVPDHSVAQTDGRKQEPTDVPDDIPDEPTDTHDTSTNGVQAQATPESDLINQSMKPTSLESQPWSNPTQSSSHSRSRSHAPDLSDKYAQIMSHPSGLVGAMADAGIKVVPAFDYMRLKLKDVDRAVRVQPVLRALEEFAEREREKEKAERMRVEEGKKREEMERKERRRLELQQKGSNKAKNKNKGQNGQGQQKAHGSKSEGRGEGEVKAD